MVRLSYAGVEDWQKGHLRAYIVRLRKVCGDGLRAYAWCAELQKRGAVHYHLMLVVLKGTNVPTPDAGMWVHGSSNIQTGRSVFYLCTYTGKEYQKVGKFPKGMRMYAVWASKEFLDEAAQVMLKLSAFPAWLAAEVRNGNWDNIEFPTRNAGGGWLWKGAIYNSPWGTVNLETQELLRHREWLCSKLYAEAEQVRRQEERGKIVYNWEMWLDMMAREV
jgi:hypothetical protein